MNTDKKEFESPVTTGEISSEDHGRWFLVRVRPIFYTVILHFSNEYIPLNSSSWKRKGMKDCFKLDGA